MYIYICIYIYICWLLHNYFVVFQMCEEQQRLRRGLAFTRYCYDQYCIVYSIHTEGRKASRILSNHRAILLHQGGQCRWAGGVKGWLIRVHTSFE